MKKQITVVIAGLGPRGYHTYGRYQNLYPSKMKVVGIADTDIDKVNDAKKELNVHDDCCFMSAEELFQKDKFADAAIIATQDSQHISHAILAMNKGYDILLEKPIANNLEDCLKIMDKSIELNKLVAVCHVLRYTTFYKTIKKLINENQIGQIINIDANENVGYWHMAHSFVRGNWRNSSESSPMILQKCCHDLDILNFLTEKKCISISSIGNTEFFTSEHMPMDATPYCLDCPNQDNCVYSAKKIYLSDDSITKREWLCYVVAAHPTKEKLIKALKNGPYGRCVFACDNNVVDHQSVNILYENGITAHLTMSAFSENCYRTIRIMGTNGEIEGNQDTNIVRLIRFNEKPIFYDINKIATDLSGHGGGDNAIMSEFIKKLKIKINGEKDDINISSSIVNSMQSHIMAFAAEDSRLKGGEKIDFNNYILTKNR